ncbi:MAG: hypothetical protein ACHREM_04225 [Polyangiales bacterium]
MDKAHAVGLDDVQGLLAQLEAECARGLGRNARATLSAALDDDLLKGRVDRVAMLLGLATAKADHEDLPLSVFLVMLVATRPWHERLAEARAALSAALGARAVRECGPEEGPRLIHRVTSLGDETS